METMREDCRRFIGEKEIFIVMILKFLIALCMILTIKAGVTLQAPGGSIIIIAILGGALCAFLPSGFMAFFGAAECIYLAFGISLMLALFLGLLFAVIFFLVMLFFDDAPIITVIGALLCAVGLPFVMPVSLGLLKKPSASASACAGVLVFGALKWVSVAGSALSPGGDSSPLTLVSEAFKQDTAFIFTIVLTGCVTVMVSVIRRLPYAMSCYIAAASGIIVNLLAPLIAGLTGSVEIEPLSVMLSFLVSLASAGFIIFMDRSLGSARTEYLETEDEDYVYYIKAVPKTGKGEGRDVKY